jgi:hypothetical protein
MSHTFAKCISKGSKLKKSSSDVWVRYDGVNLFLSMRL